MTGGSPLKALQSVWHASTEAVRQAAGVGLDLVEVEPLRQLLESGGRAFVDTTWTAREQRDANGQAEGLAGRWAAKEAVMKVLQHGIGDVDPLEVEIVTTPSGAPLVELHGAALAIAKSRHITTWHVSLTHDGGWAAAIAIASLLHLNLTSPVVTPHEGRNLG